MNIKLISILCVALGVSSAHAQTTVSGEFFGNLTFELDNDAAGVNEGKGISTERARIGVTHAFNDTWNLTLGVDGAGAGGATFNRAFITGKNLLADGHTMRFGMQQNAYVRTWETNNARWIHSDLASTYAATLTGLGAIVSGDNLEDYSGLNYNIALNDMWAIELALNNGPTSEFQPQSEAFGYGVTVMGKFNDNMHLTLGYDNVDDYDADGTVAGEQDGFSILRANFGYTSAMIDVGLEYMNFEVNEASGNASVDGVSAAAVHANWKYNEGRGVFLKYTMPTDDDSKTALNVDNAWTVGHTWAIDKNINTGLFYTATSTEATNQDISQIQWKWGASF